MTSNPVNFPGFRISIEDALKKGVTPCGTLTGIGNFKAKNKYRKVGVVLSKLDFQAGAFDMASAEKVCKLMVECAGKKISDSCIYVFRWNANKGRGRSLIFYGYCK